MIKIIGKHKVSCNSIELVDFNSFLDGKKARVLYTDPPWGDGLMKMFATMNKKMTGKTGNITFSRMLDSLISIIKNNVDGYVFIEMGRNFGEETLSIIEPYLYNVKLHIVVYGKGTSVLISGTTRSDLELDIDLNGLSGLEIINKSLRGLVKPNDIVLDPMCGLGLTAKIVKKLGCSFYGNEMNEARLLKTIKVLEK